MRRMIRGSSKEEEGGSGEEGQEKEYRRGERAEGWKRRKRRGRKGRRAPDTSTRETQERVSLCLNLEQISLLPPRQRLQEEKETTRPLSRPPRNKRFQVLSKLPATRGDKTFHCFLMPRHTKQSRISNNYACQPPPAAARGASPTSGKATRRRHATLGTVQEGPKARYRREEGPGGLWPLVSYSYAGQIHLR